MRFALSEAAQALREATSSVLAAEVTPAAIRAGWAPGGSGGLAGDAWRKLAAIGVAGTLVPPERGGLGLDETCLVPALEEVGRSGLPGPAAETIGVAAPLLAAGPHLEGVLAGEVTVAAQLTSSTLVPYGQTAGLIVLRVGEALRGYERDALALEPCATTDGSRGAARLAAAPPAAAGTLLADDPAVIDAAWRRGVLGTAALLNGLSLRMLDLTVGYVKGREQFGKPVGSFQAIKHALASALVAVEFARPAALSAAWAHARGEAGAGAQCSMAKVLAADAAGLVTRTAIQCHGAIGYTTEYDLHLYAKRAWALIPGWGTPQWHRARLAEHLEVSP